MEFNGFKNVNVYVEGKGIVKSDILVKDGKIASFSNKDGLTLNDDLIVVPGFIDKHIHGANHSDCMYPTRKDISNVACTIASEGVATFLPTTMTQTEENIDKALKNIREYIESKPTTGAYPLGIHLEGPFISKLYKGAQVESCIVPCSVKQFKHYQLRYV